MYSLDHYDLGTPASDSAETGHSRDRRPVGHGAGGHLGHARSSHRSQADPEAVRDG